MFFDWTMILLIPAFIFTIYAQIKVSSTFRKYLEVPCASGRTGAQVARELLNNNNLHDVPVELTPGDLSDHYDPRERILRLSPNVYHGRSLASLGVAAHETGHAIQHAHAYVPLNIRNSIFPLASFGSSLGPILFIIGLFLGANRFLIDLGIIIFTFYVFFTVLTLPVEFNASSRAMMMLTNSGYLIRGEESDGARKVLSAAAMTYVAAAAMAILQLLRMVLIRGNRDE